MAEYSLAFAQSLAATAQGLISDGIEEQDGQRTVLYLSLLSSEIALKALLEEAGVPVPDIKKRSHRLNVLLSDLGNCEVEVEVAPGSRHWVSAARLRAECIDPNFGNATVGTLLEAEEAGASQYPNQIRYGDVLKHYPAPLMARMAEAICVWASKYGSTIRVA